MGRFGGLFKKSEKGKPEVNPYAQQSQPADTQSSAPQQYGQNQPSEYPGPSQASHYRQEPSHSQYTQYNAAQFNDNQSVPQSSGLPSGPRPGAGYPNRVGTFSTVSADKSPPPQYSPHSSSQYSPYPGKDSPSTAATTPQTSAHPSPAVGGGGFPKEKFGATGGVGRARFEPAQTTVENGPRSPSQQQNQGGYGSLGGEDGLGLSNGYERPPKQAPVSRPGESQYGDSYGDSHEMTEQEREDADVNDMKMLIEQGLEDTNVITRRVAGMVHQGNDKLAAIQAQVQQDGERLGFAQRQMEAAHTHAKVGAVHLDDLDAANAKMINVWANSKSRIAERHEKRLNIERQDQMMSEERAREDARVEREREMQRVEAARSRGLLAGVAKQKTDTSRFEFEDDSGVQRAKNDEFDGLTNVILGGVVNMKERALVLGDEINSQNARIARMTELADRANDEVSKNHIRMTTKYQL
ncbi:hypothetical protein B0J18DRAFT_434802 [Chaetomium sp. MPI-SDFR-AT-0129]|nr:hypothetical protein B0J18DRAFT_434802 [Chaetomium sp. MPI-SDFR-AT-0129]